MKKIISLILVAVMLFSLAPMAMAYTCNPGEHDVEVWVCDKDSKGNFLGTHTGYCKLCKKNITESCSGDSSATCVRQGTCAVCGGSYFGACVLDTTKTVTSEANNMHSGTCKVCKKTVTEHCYGDSEASCVNQGVCSACGQNYYAEHDFYTGSIWTYSSTFHWHACRVESCVEIADKEAHTFVWKYDADNGHYQECSECGYKTTTVPHSYKYVCSSKCSVCNYVRGDVIHTFGDNYVQVNNQHRKQCTVCGEYSEWENCSGGTATCAKKAVCSVCGKEYGELSKTHTKSKDYKYDETAHWKYCVHCSYLYPTQNHSYGQWSVDPKDKTKQIRTCSECGYVQRTDKTERTVTFYEDNSSTKVYKDYSLTNVLNGNLIENPGTPIKTGYKFMGWWLIDEYGAYNRKFDFDNDTITDNTKIYARWNDTYKIIYKDKNGSDFSGSLDGCPTEYQYSGSDVVLIDGSKPGYSFEGWYLSPNFSGTKIEKLQSKKYTSDITLYAKLQGNTYYIDYYKNNDAATGDPMAQSTHEYGTVSHLNPNSYELLGYTFTYWSTNKDGTGKVYRDQAKVTDVTTSADGKPVPLYANWKANEYDINYFDKGGSKFSGELLDCPTSHFYDENTILNEPHKAGYDFGGWYSNPDCTGDKVTVIDAKCNESVNLYAKWIAQINSITFIKNIDGASGTMNSLTFKSGEPITLPENTFNKSGYQFIGWSETSDGSVKYIDKQDNIIVESDDPVYLFAVWGKISKVTLVTYGGKVAEDKNLTSYVEGIGALLPSKEDVILEGYELAGWYDNPEFSGDKVTFIPATASGDKIFYASWGEKTYTVSFTLVSSSSTSTTGSATVSINGGTATSVPSAGLVCADLKGTEVIKVTATPGSSYYAKIYTDSKSLQTSSKGTAVTYQLTADDIKSNSTIKISFSTNPYTGDSFDPMLWVIAMASATAGAAITIAKKKSHH